MKLHAVRMGFANNSSSSHSIVVGSILDEFNVDPDAQYHRDEFLLKSKDSKRGYLAAQIINGLKGFFGDRVAILIAKELLGEKIPVQGEIDHQSCYDFPYEFGSSPRKPCLDFCEEFTKFILNSDNLHIAGGNDETSMEEKIYYGPKEEKFACMPTDGYYRDNLVCRKDGNYWTLFNRNEGAKIRISFDSDEPFVCATRPELVDLKITNNCKFCYQSSTRDGKHGSVDGIIQSVAAMEVFEIALGGGETTMHPSFPSILKIGNEAGTCMNFTTFDMNWINDREIETAVIMYAKSFALSYGDGGGNIIKKIKRAGLWKRTVDYPGSISVQAILELIPDYQVKNLVSLVKDSGLENLTILGHKSWGRASEDKIDTVKSGQNLSYLINACKEKGMMLAVDTAVVERYKKVLDEESVNQLLRTDRDGNFSMYVDAVNQTIAANSYGAEPIAIPNEYYGFEEIVAKHFPFRN